MRIAITGILALLAATPAAFAQLSPSMAPNPYAQPSAPNSYAQPNPYAVPQAGVQQAQYPYGNYYAPPPSYYAPRMQYGPPYYYGYNNGYGVNYYYVNNPYGYPGPYRPGNAAPAPVNVPAYPEPTQSLPPLAPGEEVDPAPIEGETEPETQPGPTGLFHRPTHDAVWFDAGYMASFLRPMHMNGPLVTTGNAADAIPGALGQPGTTSLFGDKSVDYGLFSGVRAAIGVFLDHDNRFSLDVAGFYLFPNASNFSIAGDQNGNPLISRPYYNVANGFNDQFRFANTSTAALTGAIAIDSKTELAGMEFNGRFHCYVQDRYHFDFLAGLRYLRLDESLGINERVNALPGSTIPFNGVTYNPPDFITDQDGFRTINQFFGAQIGARLDWEEKWFTLGSFVKLGMGATVERSEINGSTTLNGPAGAIQSTNGGVLALPSNSGTFTRTGFGLVPELGLDLRVNVTQNVAVTLGYSFLYWNHVVRPGSQYDLNVNPGQVPSSFFFGTTTGPSAPTSRLNEEVFWMSSFNLGLEVRF